MLSYGVIKPQWVEIIVLMNIMINVSLYRIDVIKTSNIHVSTISIIINIILLLIIIMHYHS